ncbi:NUDIX hydrolase [Rhodoplanes roseus]|uniref:NUDIX hydrolase n=1 Tax=Rhodoplanes roseus TaxID=29409 RepID=A0A327L5Y6_9BRAD|nr:NUDIX hydrolase [Rhodoplanes roseus]RAI45777.1 NUDIX hydrolase [Rhodoplanes roseus]
MSGPGPSDPRAYPSRPFLAVSAAVFRAGRVLLVRRARAPSAGPWTLPGGVVEAGETLHDAVTREIAEETALAVAPVALAGHREVILRDPDGRAERHFVVLAFAARWLAGEPVLDAELAAFDWHDPATVAGLDTTEGLAEIVAAAQAILGAA